MQKSRFSIRDHEDILCKGFVLFSAYFDGRSIEVCWLLGKSVKTVCVLVFADLARRHCLLDLTIKDKGLRLGGVYAPNKNAERSDLFWPIEPFLSRF